MLREILDDYIRPKKKKFSHNRMLTVGASEIGTCARRIWYVKNQHEHDGEHQERWGATKRGDLIEAKLWVPALRKRFGDDFRFGGTSQQTFIDGPLSATPDGLLANQPSDLLKHLGVDDIHSDCILIEAKSIDPRVNLSEEKHHHAMQVQVQMGAVRAKTKLRPEYALLTYVDASFLDNVTEFPIRFDQKKYDNARLRAAKILGADKASDMKPEGYIAGGSDCIHCPFAKACGIERHNLPDAKFNVEVDPQFRAEMVDVVRKAQKAKERAEEATAMLRDYQDDIKTRLREKGVRKIPGVCTWTAVKGRPAWRYKELIEAARAAGIDVEQFSSVGEETDRLTLELP